MDWRLVRMVSIVSGCITLATAQVDWIARGSGLPTLRHGAAMAFDSLHGVTVLFGGNNGQLLDDTWQWAGAGWWPLLGASPPPRVSHAMAFDSQRGCVVLFGGWNGAVLGDTWECANGVWSMRAGSGPAARTGMALAYDSQRGRTVMFGGILGLGVFANDTWEWDGTVWTRVASTGPMVRQGHAMAFDSQRARVLLFGGNASLGSYFLFDDTWEWDGAAWTQVANSGPPGRVGHTLAYDVARARSVLFGGEGQGAVLRNDTWQWDGVAWTPLATTTMLPRVAHAMAYDSLRQRTVMFGGYTGNFMADTWELTATTAAATPYGVGCSIPPLTLLPVAGAVPAIGTTAIAEISQIPAGFATIAVGWSRQSFGPWSLPLDLAGAGMHACQLWQSADVFGLAVTFTGATTARFAQPLPNWTPLIGMHLYLQAFALAPGANVAGVSASNGLDWYVGR